MKEPLKNHLIVPLYDLNDALPCDLLKKWWDEIETWAGLLGISPNEVAATFKQKPHRLTDDQGYCLAKYRRRILAQLEANNVEYLHLCALEPEWEYKAWDVSFNAKVGWIDDSTICSSEVTLESLDRANGVSALAFAEEALRRGRGYVAAKYGFATIMPRKFMPGGYAIGLASGNLPDELNYDCNAWMDSGKECDRTLRNVYGYNILNVNHLETPIGQQPLGEWVKASRERGRIEPLGDKLFLWTFQQGDDQKDFLTWDYPPVVAVREELKKYSIFPWQKLAEEMGVMVGVASAAEVNNGSLFAELAAQGGEVLQGGAGLPIQEFDKVDVIVHRTDGGVDLAIVTTGPLDDDMETRLLLLSKVQHYLEYINSKEFKREFKNPPAEKTNIVIRCPSSPSAKAAAMIDEMKSLVKRHRARLVVEVE
jgi:hypothetical protein